jgi:hypothetical protein
MLCLKMKGLEEASFQIDLDVEYFANLLLERNENGLPNIQYYEQH